ncbi:MAG: GGDEF domain-containing protein [Terracidiphilus sp.]
MSTLSQQPFVLTATSPLQFQRESIGQAARSYDSVLRYGGEEFLIALTDCGRHQYVLSAERICSAIATTPIPAGGAEIQVTASIGITAVEAGNLVGKQALALADPARYKAKNSRRNRTSAA